MTVENVPLPHLSGFELTAELKRRYEQGATIQQLAGEAQRPYSTIRNMLKRSGVVFRKSGSRSDIPRRGTELSSPPASRRKPVSAEAEALGNAFRTLRVQHGLTLAVVAERIQVAAPTICNIELAIKVPQRLAIILTGRVQFRPLGR